jgi:1,2-diacylglycerol 3-beta-galactosyltransferase
MPGKPGPRIQLWSGRMGGHMRIAQALSAALAAQAPQARVEVVDIYARPVVGWAMSAATNAYDRLVAFSLPGWSALYRRSSGTRSLGLVRALGARSARRRPGLARLVEPSPPDVIVRLISDLGQSQALLGAGAPWPPVVTVVSDLVSIHPGWVAPVPGDYVVPTDEAAQALRQLGVPAGHIRRTGFPIRAHLFCPGPPERPALPRPDGRLRVLLMGGSSGSGRLLRDVRELVRARLPLDLTVVCGKNDRLLRRLRTMTPAPPTRLAALGYTDAVPQLMHAADLLITKAGPSTVFEAAACGLPALLNSYLPGQEEGNVELFERLGVARAARSPAETVSLLRAFLAEPARLRWLVNPALAAETCRGAAEVAGVVLAAAGG